MGKVKFGDGNIASSGCSITCLAMVMSYLTGDSVTPNELAIWAGNRFHVPNVGQGWDIFPAAARKYGVNCVGLGESMNNVINALKSEKTSNCQYGCRYLFYKKRTLYRFAGN